MTVVITLLILLLTVVSSEYFDDLSLSLNFPVNTCPLPRIRKAWIDHTPKEKSDFVRLVAEMKLYQVKWSNYAYTGRMNSLYDYFAEIHNTNTAYWHYCSLFLPVHRYYLWKFETALQFIARVKGPTMNPSITNPCPTVPYWSWDFDCNLNGTSQNNSALFDGGYVGPKPNPRSNNYTVPSGAFAGWKTYEKYNTFCGAASCRTVDNEDKYGPRNNLFKRYFDSGSKFTHDSSSIFLLAADNQNFLSFSKTWEGWHATAHTWLAYAMASQRSPSDPVFFMHHAQIDRVWAIWQDCWDYDAPSTPPLTNNDNWYSASTWNSNPPVPTYSFKVDDPIPFALSSTDTGPFGGIKVIVTDIYGMGTKDKKGLEGMFFRYGPDFMVTNIAVIKTPVCKKNFNGWTLVNQPLPTSKRDLDTGALVDVMLEKANYTVNRDKVKQYLSMAKERANSQKKSGLEGLKFIVNLICPELPKMEITDNLIAFLEGNGASRDTLSNLDSVCDNVSERFCIERSEHRWCNPSTAISTKVEETSESQSPLYAVAWSAVGVITVITLLLLALVVMVAVRVYRKSNDNRINNPETDAVYSQM